MVRSEKRGEFAPFYELPLMGVASFNFHLKYKQI
jgi:hypothetical protein